MKNITNKILLFLAFGAIATSCQKKFDPSSYAPKLNIGGFTSADEIAPSNLVAHWSFENSWNELVSGNAGTVTGSTFGSGLKGNSLVNSGSSYVVYNTPAALQNLKSFTVALWVKADLNTAGIAGLFDIANSDNFWGNLTIFFENGGSADVAKLKIHVNNNGADGWLGNYDLNKIWGVWTHIAVTYDAASSTFNVYSNGSNIATQTIAGFGNLVFQNASKMVLGTVDFQTTPSLTNHGPEPWASYLSGNLDEVRVYNKALSNSEISSLLILEGKGK
jgi:hypothetical protein